MRYIEKFAIANGLIFFLAAVAFPAHLSFKDIPDYRVFQRDVSSQSAWIGLQGDVQPGMDSVRVCVFLDTTQTGVLPWKKLDISSGHFHDSLRVPQGGWYRLQYGAFSASGEVESQISGKWGVGMNILCIGQSNMSGRGEGRYRIAPDLAALYGNDYQWKHLKDPYDAGGIPGQIDFDDRNPKYSMIPRLSELLLYLKIPIGIIPAAKGSTAMFGMGRDCWSYRNESNHRDSTNLYGNSLSKVDSVGGVELIILHQGEKDAVPQEGYAVYKSAFEKMLANYREDLSDSIRIFYCELGSLKSPQDTSYQAIQQVQSDVNDGKLNILAVKTQDLEVLPPDNIHFTAASLDIMGERMARSILSVYGIFPPIHISGKRQGLNTFHSLLPAYSLLGRRVKDEPERATFIVQFRKGSKTPFLQW